MKGSGLNHIDLATEDMEATRAFYEDVLGFPLVRAEDHEGWSKSLYFTDPHGLPLEYCHLTRAFDADDAVPRVHFRTDGRRKLPAD